MNRDRQKLFKDIIFGFALAGEVVGSFVAGLLIGLFLDNRFSTKPLFTFILLVLAFIQVIVILLRAGKR